GDTNFYRYVANGPANATDPSGKILKFKPSLSFERAYSPEEQEVIKEKLRKQLETIKAKLGDRTLAGALAAEALGKTHTVDIIFDPNANDAFVTGKADRPVTLNPRFPGYLPLAPGVDPLEFQSTKGFGDVLPWVVILHELGHHRMALNDPTDRQGNPCGP